ncbi:MAG: DUF805 domain-containing protein [Coriobacteriia bacterium]|nr:DUF805 domain-containing protein [Coriobacteriia bacterium]
MSWYLGVWKKYATFGGRARRKEYWMFYLFNIIFGFVLSFTDSMLGLTNEGGSGPLYGLYGLAVLLPAIAVGVRRMHDTDRSGWWLLVPIANLVFLVSEGTQGPNQYGSDPKAPAMGYAPPGPPAGWLPDPTGRHQFRYWDSTQWTSSVSDNGVASVDNL